MAHWRHKHYWPEKNWSSRKLVLLNLGTASQTVYYANNRLPHILSGPLPSSCQHWLSWHPITVPLKTTLKEKQWIKLIQFYTRWLEQVLWEADILSTWYTNEWPSAELPQTHTDMIELSCQTQEAHILSMAHSWMQFTSSLDNIFLLNSRQH